MQLPSKFQIGDSVSVDFMAGGSIVGRICKVTFAKDKILYNVDVPIVVKAGKVSSATRIHSIDSAFVSSR